MTAQQMPLSRLLTFQLQGVVDPFYRFDRLESLRKFVTQSSAFVVIGKGSNTLMDPQSVKCPVIQISPEFSPIQFHNGELRVNAGVSVTRLLGAAQKYGIGGFEFFAGVPASVGGMVVMNFGCWGASFSDVVDRVHVMKPDGSTVWIGKKDLDFGYRYSRAQVEPWVVLEAVLVGRPDQPPRIKSRIRDAIHLRMEKQPLKDKTFGSVFKNPSGGYAAQVLESLGFKGKGEGAVQFSDKHANFLLNKGGATYSETVTFIRNVQQYVRDQTGVALELEVRLIS